MKDFVEKYNYVTNKDNIIKGWDLKGNLVKKCKAFLTPLKN